MSEPDSESDALEAVRILVMMIQEIMVPHMPNAHVLTTICEPANPERMHLMHSCCDVCLREQVMATSINALKEIYDKLNEQEKKMFDEIQLDNEIMH